MFFPEDVTAICRRFAEQEIRVWLVGGWGIDALLGEQTRPHKDLDLLMLVDDVIRLRALLETDGYRLKELWSENLTTRDSRGAETETAFVLIDAKGRELDIHALRLDADGNGIPAWEGEGIVFSKEGLAGEGIIAGMTTPCISPAMQIVCHTGYELPDRQRGDLEHLRQKFGVELPGPAG